VISTLAHTRTQLDKLVLSKDPISRTLQWAMTLPPTLALFVAHASPPHAIVVANKKWKDLTGLPDPTHENLDVLQGLDSDKHVLAEIFGQEKEVRERVETRALSS